MACNPDAMRCYEAAVTFYTLVLACKVQGWVRCPLAASHGLKLRGHALQVQGRLCPLSNGGLGRLQGALGALKLTLRIKPVGICMGGSSGRRRLSNSLCTSDESAFASGSSGMWGVSAG